MSNEELVYQDDEEWKAFEQKSIPSRKFLIRYPECPVIPPDFRAGTYLEYLFMDICSVCSESKDKSEKKELLFVSELIRSAALYVPFEKVIFLLFSTLRGQGISLEIFSSASEMKSLATAYGVSGLIKFLKGFHLRLTSECQSTVESALLICVRDPYRATRASAARCATRHPANCPRPWPRGLPLRGAPAATRPTHRRTHVQTI